MPQRPYLIRALYEWIVDSNEIPYVLVDATVEGVQVPQEHVADGQIVLNLSSNAVRDLNLGNEYVMCSGRFSGRVFELCLPVMSIKAIYGKDSGQGMVFPEETFPPAGSDDNQYQVKDLEPDTSGVTAPEQFSASDAAAGKQDPKDGGDDDKPKLRLV